MSKNPKKWVKLVKRANIDREFLHIFWMTWRNSMKFSGKMCFKITLKVTKNRGSTLSVEDTFFKKPQGGGGGVSVNLTPYHPPLPGRLGLTYFCHKYNGFLKKQIELLLWTKIVGFILRCMFIFSMLQSWTSGQT